MNCVELTNSEMLEINGGSDLSMIVTGVAIGLSGIALATTARNCTKVAIGLTATNLAVNAPILVAGCAMTVVGLALATGCGTYTNGDTNSTNS